MQSPLVGQTGPNVLARPSNYSRHSSDQTERKSPRTAAQVEREAKTAVELLKALLKAQPPWSREVESNRQKARNFYLTLLFAHPLSPQAQSLDPLWLNTSYTLISSYRDVIARVEAAMPPNKRKGNKMGDPEYRKGITRFRQALATEETFYRGLIGRIVGFYQLQPFTESHLFHLGIPVPGHVDGWGGDQGLAPVGKEEAREKVALVYKALICIGDLQRYREQYGGPKMDKVRSKTGEEVYGKAIDYYETARGLLPDDGTAFNQLAVISTYMSDDFQTAYYYFRALAVRSPFKNGEEITDKFLKKVFERSGQEQDLDQVGLWKRDFVLVVSVIYRKSGLSKLPSLNATILPTLTDLLSSRQLPSEVIVKLTAMAIGAQWHARQSAAVGQRDDQRHRKAEEAAIDLVLGIATVMLAVAKKELGDASNNPLMDDSEDALHVLISAVLRRILPSLRIISKWLKLHLDYVQRVRPDAPFWTSYADTITAFGNLFPIVQLPSLTNALEEDIDMRGFTPLSRGMVNTTPQAESHVVHPNEEQLMRIADLQVDAGLIVQQPASASRDEEIASVSTETEDDPVNLAMRATLGEGESIEDEVIIWDRSSQPPIASAHDLLQNLLLESHTPPSASPGLTQRQSPGMLPGQGSPGLLFGGDTGGIWRMTREESAKGMKRAGQAEKAREDYAQKEALKAIWSDAPHVSEYQTQPAPSGLVPPAWVANDAASLYAGLSANWSQQVPARAGSWGSGADFQANAQPYAQWGQAYNPS